VTQFEHFTEFFTPPLGTDNIVPKKERFSFPQFGHGPFKIRKSFTITLVIACAIQNIKGSAANHVKMKLKGSGNCVNQKNAVTTNKNPWVNT